MSNDEWRQFFDIMEKVTNMDETSWVCKRDFVTMQAEAHDHIGDLDEFVGWFGGELED